MPDDDGESIAPGQRARSLRVRVAVTALVMAMIAAVWAGSLAWREHSARSTERLEDTLVETLSSVTSERATAHRLLEPAERGAAWDALSEAVSAADISALVGPQLIRLENETEWVRHHADEAREVVELLEDARAELADATQAFRDAVG